MIFLDIPNYKQVSINRPHNIPDGEIIMENSSYIKKIKIDNGYIIDQMVGVLSLHTMEDERDFKRNI